jgi:hypothetical protein
MNDSVFASDMASLVGAYYRREIGSLMHQAEHWAAKDKPLAVHHRLRKADAYYQVVVLFERHGKHDENVFDIMRGSLARQDIVPPGRYPPSADLHPYREPAFVAALVKGEQPPADQVFVPGQWRCPKCKFVLSQMNLNASDGAVTARDDAGDNCPNCDKPLWRVTWKDDAMEMAARCEEQMTRAVNAESEIQRLRIAMAQACDLAAERVLGHPARSAGHNARLVLENALGGGPGCT